MSGWEFDKPGKPGSKDRDHGLILRHVSHDNFPFADDIGVAAIWINPGRFDAGHHGPFVLAPPDFSLSGDVIDIGEENTKAPKPFEGYAIERAIRQVYVSNPIENDPVLGGDLGLLSIEQSYRFSAYGKDPPHEPTGGLPAARIFPYVTFSTLNPQIRSIRIDYRMNVIFTPPSSLIDGVWRYYAPKTQAGVFRDKDEISDVADTFIGSLASEFIPEFAANQIFAAAEKPIQYEIFGHGLRDGVADETWDNIHIWPKGEKLPSAPGTFHGGHMHWRWAKSVAEPTDEEKATLKKLGVEKAGLPQFKGVGSNGALLDPKIPNQTIRFAIAKRAKRQPETTEVFEDLFSKKERLAEKIEDGDDLDVWLSFEVKRGKSLGPFQGTTFIHGLYFAHEEEDDKSRTAFTRGISLGQEKGKRDWLRDPD